MCCTAVLYHSYIFGVWDRCCSVAMDRVRSNKVFAAPLGGGRVRVGLAGCSNKVVAVPLGRVRVPLAGRLNEVVAASAGLDHIHILVVGHYTRPI